MLRPAMTTNDFLPPLSSRTPHSTQPKHFPPSPPRLLSFFGLSGGCGGCPLFFLPSPPRTLFPTSLPSFVPPFARAFTDTRVCPHTHVLPSFLLSFVPSFLPSTHAQHTHASKSVLPLLSMSLHVPRSPFLCPFMSLVLFMSLVGLGSTVPVRTVPVTSSLGTISKVSMLTGAIIIT
jgi:hypothetical protein